MKRNTAKWLSWVIMLCMLVTMMQPLTVGAAAPDNTKWVTFKNDDFSNANQVNLFSRNGTAKTITDDKNRKVLRLTESTGNVFGSIFNKKMITSTNKYSFSTFFKFRLNANNQSNSPADGITFTIQAQSNNAGAVGQGIGYGGIKPSFAVKYDTYENTALGDPSANYIGLAVNGDVNNKAGWYTTNINSVNLSNGNDYYSWIDYDGATNNVKVYIGSSPTRPNTPVLNVTGIDLESIFQGKPGVYAGFTAATGGAMETHDILSWYFVNELDPIDTTQYQYKQAPTEVKINAVPTGEPGKYNVIATLYDVDGNPVAGAPVSLNTSQGTIPMQSDGNGQASTVVDFGSNPPSDITAIAVGGAYATVKVPPAPTNLSTGTTAQTANKLTWNTVSTATYYNVYKDGALYATNVTGATYNVTGLTPGEFATFTVTAVTNNAEGTAESLPSNSVKLPIPLDLAIDSPSYTLPVGSTHQTVVSSVYSDGSKVEVTNKTNFTSTNSTVATVDPDGLVTAIGAGTTVIEAVYNGKKVQATVTVPIAAPTGVATKDVTSTEATVSWNAVPGAQSYNIYDNGKLIASGVTGTQYTVTGLTPGTEHSFTVSAVSNGIVSQASGVAGATTTTLRDLLVDPANATLVTGAAQQTQTSAVYLDESVKDVTKQASYISSNPAIVTVDANGLLTAKAPGTATITVTFDGKTTTQTIVVQDQAPQFSLTFSTSPETVVGDGHSKVTLSAKATSPNGGPVAGVPVTFHFGNNSADDVTVITNEQGIASTEYTVPALQGIIPVSEVITATATDTKSGLSQQQSVAMTYMPAAVYGIIMDQVTGKPASGATVSVTADFDGDGVIDFNSTITTGPDGSYQIPVPRGNFTYTMNIQTPVQIGNQTVTLKQTQTATVGQLSGVGQKIDSTNKISGSLFIASSADSQPTVGSMFGNGNVSAQIQGMNGNTFTSTLPLDAEGNFELANVPQGEYKITYQIKAPDGTILAGPSTTVKVNQNGELGVVYSLIDPYGVVTDAYTGQVLEGVTTQLYWADTELNRQNGRKPNTLVTLPELSDFAPNQNHNPQITDAFGQYAWMVYPDGDYYIVATKPGYINYSTLDAKPNVPAANGSSSYIKDGIIHVGQDVVGLDFSMRRIPSSDRHSSGGGSSYVAPAAQPSLNLTVDKNLVKEGDQSTITLDYKNTSASSMGAGVITFNIPQGAEVVSADGGTVNGNTITWNIADLPAGQAGSFKVVLKWDLLTAVDAQFDISGQFAVNGGTDNAVKADSTVKIKVFSDRFGQLKHQRYILGYPDGKFHPDNTLTRAELAAIVARLTENVTVNDAITYTDVKENHWAANYIKIATKHGYFSGFEDGSFRPEAQVSRGELASVMARFLKQNVTAPAAYHFQDTEGHWAADAIEQLYRGKFLAGYQDGTFKPDDSIRRVEAVTMINRMLYRGPLKGTDVVFPDVPESHWGFGDVQEATVSHESTRNQDGSEAWKNQLADEVQ
ncbi:S-layer homology domain-containing protein [Paenibacillus sp. UNC451MF]|uniref:S-layer homology domain-containing protein n=1 Tax=Paenibacillus sp. UNC451MF TaxID=1449063 RepID=UPI00048AC0EC|nr:S-layer homology domain-containing protein [Paenibacillus sp. UNC451MF]